MSEIEDKIAYIRAQAPTITRRLQQGSEFLRDVLDDPRILEEIPTGATLHFRDVTMDQGQVRLTAYHTPEMADWMARVTGVSGEVVAERPPFAASGPTAEAALDALETEVRRVVRVAAGA